MIIQGLRWGYRRLAFLIGSIRLLPHLAAWRLSPNRGLIDQDVARWREAFLTADYEGISLLGAFLLLMNRRPEYRSLFYHRLGSVRGLIRFLCPPPQWLVLGGFRLGGGLVIQHGLSTIVMARRIGSNCWINQQVTIGSRGDGTDFPTLGDNVAVGAGAKILGGITIGDDVRIGANAVVVKDVPSGVTVVGPPAFIVKRDGRRVNEPL